MKEKFTTRQLTLTALMAAVMCVLGPLSLPIGPVPISLFTLVAYFAAYLLGGRLASFSTLVYLLLGGVGLPVFAGYAGGIDKLAGPTGGFLVGYLPLALLAGLVAEKGKYKPLPAAWGMLAGTLVCYLLGTACFVVVMQCGVGYALTVCVLPFLLGDAAKIAVATLFGALLRGRLQKAGVLE